MLEALREGARLLRWSASLLATLWGDRLRDRRLGIDTCQTEAERSEGLAVVQTGRFRDSNGYGPSSYAVLRALSTELGIGPGDVFVDLGCGKGRALCVMALTGAKAVGVELEPRLASAAAENARRLRGAHGPIEIIEGDAAVTRIDDGTIYYLHHPFGYRTLKSALEALEASRARRPRRIRLVYHLPLERWQLDECPWLKLERELPAFKTAVYAAT